MERNAAIAEPVACVAQTRYGLPTNEPEEEDSMQPLSVTILATPRAVEQGAFWGTPRLTSVVISDGVKEVGANAFNNCVNLVSVALPDSVSKIGVAAFSDCSRLHSVIIPSKVRYIAARTFACCTALTSAVIPNGVTDIAMGAFDTCVNLTTLALPPSVTRVGPSAFFGCRRLQAIVLPERLTEIGALAFDGCSSLTSLELPQAVEVVGVRAFANCEWLIVATFRGNLNNRQQRIGKMFAGCHRLRCVVATSLVASPKDHFDGTSLLEYGGLLEDTPASRHRAAALRFWSRPTHRLCSPERRSWVGMLLLIAARLRLQGLFLPLEMWMMILGCVPRHLLG